MEDAVGPRKKARKEALVAENDQDRKRKKVQEESAIRSEEGTKKKRKAPELGQSLDADRAQKKKKKKKGPSPGTGAEGRKKAPKEENLPSKESAICSEEGTKKKRKAPELSQSLDADRAQKKIKEKKKKKSPFPETGAQGRKEASKEKNVPNGEGTKDQMKESQPQQSAQGKRAKGAMKVVEPTKENEHEVTKELDAEKENEKKKKEKKKKKKSQGQGNEAQVSKDATEDGVLTARTKSLTKATPHRQEGEAVLLFGDRAEHWKDDDARTDLKYGKFSKEEDDIVRAAVAEYIKERSLGEDGLEKLLNTRKHKEVLGAWLEIGRCLPERSVKRVHARACRILHEGNYKGKWSREEEERLQTLHSRLGPKWAEIGGLMGRLPDACKDKWKTLRVTDKKEGKWSPEESDRLSRLVNESLAQKRLGSSLDRAIDGRQVRDDIDWTAISHRLGGRTANQCLRHWYGVLVPGTVRTRTAVEEWGTEDDRVMLQRIVESGASSEPDVEWDNLLKDRDGATCRKRWRMMVKHLPPSQAFEENLTKLCERYAAGLA